MICLDNLLLCVYYLVVSIFQWVMNDMTPGWSTNQWQVTPNLAMNAYAQAPSRLVDLATQLVPLVAELCIVCDMDSLCLEFLDVDVDMLVWLFGLVVWFGCLVWLVGLVWLVVWVLFDCCLIVVVAVIVLNPRSASGQWPFKPWQARLGVSHGFDTGTVNKHRKLEQHIN